MTPCKKPDIPPAPRPTPVLTYKQTTPALRVEKSTLHPQRILRSLSHRRRRSSLLATVLMPIYGGLAPRIREAVPCIVREQTFTGSFRKAHLTKEVIWIFRGEPTPRLNGAFGRCDHLLHEP